MKFSRRAFLKIGLPGFAAGLGGVSYSTLLEPNLLSVERVMTPLRNLPSSFDGFRIAVLSDFHLQPFTKIEHIQSAVQLANSLKRDVVVLLGDFVDETVEAIHDLAPALSQLNARHGVFAVLGNHDYWNGAKIVQRGLQASGIPVLVNSGVELQNGVGSVFFAGVESAWAGRPNLAAAMDSWRGNIPTVLLAHEPDYADTAALDPRVSLQLSGHSHGGQVRLPMIGALRLPSWGRRYDHGLYRIQDLQLYTNRGIGMACHPVRFNCPPEITEVTLVPG